MSHSNQTHLDECLSVRDGHLMVEDCDTTDLVARFGSPLFVISEAQLRRNLRRFQTAFAAAWPDGPVDVLPALKANNILATRQILTQEGAGADLYSCEGELYAALQTGVKPELVSLNGGGKSEQLLRMAIEAGVRITVEDLDEPALIDRIARELGTVAKIRLRVKPNFPGLWQKTDFTQEYASIDLGIQGYKAGIPAQYLSDLGKQIFQMEHVELMGLHLHIGRHRPDLWYWKRLMTRYAAFIAELCRAWGGYQPQEIDIGGGFATPRDPHNKLGLQGDVVASWLTWPLQLLINLISDRLRYQILSKIIALGFIKSPNTRHAPSIEDYAATAAGTLRRELLRHGVNIAGTRLQLEPGRGLYGDAGIHLTRVKKVKHQTEPIPFNWILTDTTYFFLNGGVLEYNLHDFRVANKVDASSVQVADIVGQSCFGDRILPWVRVPALEPGDIIAFLDTGAYQEASASNFNALPRPATVLVNGSNAEVIRQGESVADVFARDVIPERLLDTPSGD